MGRLSAKQAILGLTNVDNPKSIWIDNGVFQFPIVKCANLQNIHVSISHCDNIGVAIAYSEAHPMGIDIERISSDRLTLFASQMAPHEINILEDQFGGNVAYYAAIFSIKEALSKVLKTGMMIDFKFLEVEKLKIYQQTLECIFTHFGQYKAFSYVSENYVFSVVLPRRTKMAFNLFKQVLSSYLT